jgi:hypothetical protein
MYIYREVEGEVEGEGNTERRLSRTLTQRYDMHSLRALQELEVHISSFIRYFIHTYRIKFIDFDI